MTNADIDLAQAEVSDARRSALSAEDRITLPPASSPKLHWTPVTGVPRIGGLVRPRVYTTLDRILDARICAVVAPAGSGKTTALAHWARHIGVDVAWWRAQPDLGDPVTALLAGLAAALHDVDGRPAGTVPVWVLVDRLNRRDSPVVVVVDDLQHIACHEVGRMIERLLLATGEHVHLVVSTRAAPPLNLARTELASLVVGPTVLRFRPAETRELFGSWYGSPLGDDDAWVLTRRTAGWAAGLQLFHHWVAGRPPEVRHRAVGGVNGRISFAREYLGQTLLADLDGADAGFLRSTATFEVLIGACCDELLGDRGSHDRLADLARRGVLSSLEDGSGFVLPPVLRVHLVADLRDELGDSATDARFRATAAILLAADPSHPAAAARAAAAGHDWQTLLDILSAHEDRVIGDPDLDWLDAVPTGAAERPGIAVAQAERARRDGRLGEALRLLAAVTARGGATPAAAALDRFCRMWTTGDLQPADGWSDHLRVVLRRPNPDRHRDLPPPYDAVLHLTELVVYGDLLAARRAVRCCIERLHGDAAAECAVELLEAALHPDEPELADSVAARAEELGWPWFARVAHVLAHHCHDGEAVAAEVAAADDRGDSWGALLLAGLGALTRLRDGHAAALAFDELIGRCRALDATALEAWARAGLALSSAASGLPDSTRDAESAVAFAHSAQVPGALAIAHAALALVRGDARLLRSAEELAARVGLGCRPWEWVAPKGWKTPLRATVRDRTPPLLVRCFGGFELLIGGEAPSLSGVRPRARALLRLLALYAGQPVHREVIVDAMWPQLDVAAATHNLHVCVSGLRTALEPGVPRGASQLIPRVDDRYTLALPDGGVCDLRTFDARTAAAERARAAGRPDDAIADLEEALRLYVGDVLPEDGPTEWVLPHREHYKVRAAEAASLLGRLRLDQGRPDLAAAAARRSIDVDAARDASWRLLIAAHDAAGDLAAAAEARRSYADVLSSLGVASSAAAAIRSSGRR